MTRKTNRSKSITNLQGWSFIDPTRIKVKGNLPDLGRVQTGFPSLDQAIADSNPFTGEFRPGLPLRSIIEVAGPSGIGKSTLCYGLAGLINPTGRIVIADLETLKLDFALQGIASSGFTGEVEFVSIAEKRKKDNKDVPASAETILESAKKMLLEDSTSALIIDSVGNIVSKAEIEGKIGEAHMGLRARLVAQFARAVSGGLRIKENPAVVFLVNHVHQILGAQGSVTSGGVVKDYLSTVRLRVWQDHSETYKFDDGSFVIRGIAEKVKFGADRAKFIVAVKAGYGIHRGLTCLFDCCEQGIASRENVVKMGGKSYGRIGDILEKKFDDPKFFDPFILALND